ncbi:MAG: hypothetical protein M1837_005437 [Sclerophora amabilis]|nr:MAG: hypothetical protein M1837_005437 [Sclerophora amabilis]
MSDSSIPVHSLRNLFIAPEDDESSDHAVVVHRNENPSATPDTTSSLEELQSKEQQNVLNIVADLRKCGIERMLSLPQLVVCGDQSAGKSSVLEALTEIPFPRNDNLCTRFATEIILRRAASESITIKVLPDSERPGNERDAIESFTETISDFSELPQLMDKAMTLMGLNNHKQPTSRAFARDVLSVEIEGPSRPQLTLVDLPGLIQSQTRGVTEEDVKLVKDLTHQYISQHRTICLAVVSATNDYANQGILDKVREVDPEGERTLGIITKPDRLPAGSGSEQAYIDLAKNQDIFFKLGWHVLKNRSFEEGASSFEERNASETSYFRNSKFATLSKDSVGIASLRDRLSGLLFNHIKRELPKLREDLEKALGESGSQLETMGDSRATPTECKTYLMQLSLDVYEICKAAVNGHYEGGYFAHNTDQIFSPELPATLRRLRAVVYYRNDQFSKILRTRGHKYHIKVGGADKAEGTTAKLKSGPATSTINWPSVLLESEALEWVGKAIARTRGKELPGNFNPLLIGELFWEQSEKWERIAKVHMESVAHDCSRFLDALLREKCPKDVHTRLWSFKIEDALKARSADSVRELKMLMEDLTNHPITYNHYYTDTIKKRRRERGTRSLADCIENATHARWSEERDSWEKGETNVAEAVREYSDNTDPDMGKHSSEEAIDCLFAIYKLSQKTFIDNVTTQVVERHIVRGLEKIFSPVVVNSMSDAEIETIASEPPSAKRQRNFLHDRIRKLQDGQSILRNVLRSAAA